METHYIDATKTHYTDKEIQQLKQSEVRKYVRGLRKAGLIAFAPKSSEVFTDFVNGSLRGFGTTQQLRDIAIQRCFPLAGMALPMVGAAPIEEKPAEPASTADENKDIASAFDEFQRKIEALSKGKGLDEESIKQAVIDAAHSAWPAFINQELGKRVVSDIQSGKASLLPPVRSVCPHYRENSLTKTLTQEIHSGSHIIISGPSGAGKTYPIEQVLNKLGLRWLKVSCADGVTMSELIAEKSLTVQNGAPKLEVILKIIPFAMREGIKVILDEADQLPPEILSLLNAAMDRFPAEILIPQTGERVQAKAGFQIILTMNGLTDESGLYSGHQVSGALRTRCRFVYAEYMKMSEELAILQADGLSADDSDQLLRRFIVYRKALEAGIMTFPASTRTALSISKAMQAKDVYGNPIPNGSKLSLEQACKLCIYDGLTRSEVKEVKKLVRDSEQAAEAKAQAKQDANA